MIRMLIAAMGVAVAGAALAQHGPGPAPYAGLETRAVKALSNEQIADLRAGRGMGLALPAELNGYPGPLHVIEHADALVLTPEQRARMQALYDAMKGEAAALGERLIGEEAELDRQFATRTVTPASLAETTKRIGRTQAELRAAHLKYHLATVEVLTPHQVRRYGELRGYGVGAARHAPGGHGRH